ncbi:antibiotic biosynthesis monooxygenase [Blastococcus sp. PRF04-17]|uniref:antibiotic biosynthesis monooxygenase n=1 Tax=Blastococcus sp. PRF04-17 TaxID=2933797 RepID=UPI001FF29B6D|nr:antibiotic biosynthesis monooxygenase [Blastococcus sp. PRF04-17]UOY01605.1 antibiotic biosynthesis monooxygenase [Blastococcus sp. PRF04-17]
MSVPLRLRARFGTVEADHARPEPVTVTVARVVRPQHRAAFERWAQDVLGVAARFPGNLGASLLHPGPGSSEYHLVYRFEDDRSLAAWERSSERRSALAHVEDMVDVERYQKVSGLESFFTRSPQPGPRWRMTVLTIAAVFLTTSLLQQFVMPHLAGWPLELRLLLSAVVVVLLLGHVLMPALTRVFARWLHPSR